MKHWHNEIFVLQKRIGKILIKKIIFTVLKLIIMCIYTYVYLLI